MPIANGKTSSDPAGDEPVCDCGVKLRVPLTPTLNEFVGLPVGAPDANMGSVDEDVVRGLIGVGEVGNAAEPDPPLCWDDRRRCWGRDSLSSDADRFWPCCSCLLSFSASTLALTLCITVNNSWSLDMID